MDKKIERLIREVFEDGTNGIEDFLGRPLDFLGRPLKLTNNEMILEKISEKAAQMSEEELNKFFVKYGITKIVQVCFTLKNDITLDKIHKKMLTLKEKLDKLYGNDYECRSCHLSRELCIDKGYTTEIPDMFDTIFGKRYVCELTENTFEEAMANISTHREALSKKASNLVILAGECVTNVAFALELFTNNRVIII